MSRTDLRAQAAVPVYAILVVSFTAPSAVTRTPSSLSLGKPIFSGRDRRQAVALEATKSETAIGVAVAVALASSAPRGKPAPSATSASVNMAIPKIHVWSPRRVARGQPTTAAGAAHCVGGEVVVIVVATPARVPDVIRAGVVPRVYCAMAVRRWFAARVSFLTPLSLAAGTTAFAPGESVAASSKYTSLAAVAAKSREKWRIFSFIVPAHGQRATGRDHLKCCLAKHDLGSRLNAQRITGATQGQEEGGRRQESAPGR
eukprot:scaffold61349_cov62-Phaeocystis_antarctica.AAC.5